jgi:hypothetical protein
MFSTHERRGKEKKYFQFSFVKEGKEIKTFWSKRIPL